MLLKEIKDIKIEYNRFEVVVLGGSGVIDKNRRIVINGNIFKENKLIKK